MKTKLESMQRNAERAFKMLTREVEALEAFDYDENEIDALRETATRDIARDAMSDDSVAFFSSMRDYHAR